MLPAVTRNTDRSVASSLIIIIKSRPLLLRKKKKKRKMGRTPIDSHHLQVKKSRSTFRIENPSSSNSESVSGIRLPLELITEILVRLPVKSLLKCKCVSKSWLSLISRPEFIRSHFSTSSSWEGQYSNHQLLFTTLPPNSGMKGCFINSTLHEPSTHVVDVEYPSQKPDDSLWIVGIVNGLVCLAIEENDFFLWNPVLKKSKHLPSPYVSHPENGSYVIYGFGYDESNDDYKVVSVQCVYRSGGAYETEVKVYSLMADSWRKIEDFKGGIPLDDTGKYVNGKIHWTAIESSASCESWKIVTLDMVSEKYGELQRPGYEDGVYDWVFGVLGGRLFVLCDYNLIKKTDLWVMDKYGVEESWSKVVSIPYVDVHVRKPHQVLCILSHGEIVLANGSCLLVYHPKHKEFRNIELGGCNSYSEAFMYVESLVWP